MKFTITENKIENEYPRNSFLVRVRVMHGDADLFQYVNYPGFKRNQDEELLEKFINVLREMESAYPNGRGGGDEYSYSEKVEHFNAWFDEEFDGSPESLQYFENYSDASLKLAAEVNEFFERNNNYFDWPRDATDSGWGGHSETSLDTFEVLYVDDHGDLYKVAID